MLRSLFVSLMLIGIGIGIGAGSVFAGERVSALGRGPFTALVRTPSGGYAALSYMDVDGLAISEGDIVLGQHADVQKQTLSNLRAVAGGLDRQVINPADSSRLDALASEPEEHASQGNGVTPSVLSVSSIWPDKTVPFTIDPRIGMAQQKLVLKAAAAWNALKVVTFKNMSAGGAPPDALHVLPSSTSGLCATTQPGHHATNTTYLSSDCTLGQIIHEFGHVLGLRHEQSRLDRDGYIAIDESKIESQYRPNFDTLPGSYDQTRYDPCSIMHYGNVVPGVWTTTGQDEVWFGLTALGAKAFATCKAALPAQAGCRTVGQRCAISATDKAGVAVLYK